MNAVHTTRVCLRRAPSQPLMAIWRQKLRQASVIGMLPGFEPVRCFLTFISKHLSRHVELLIVDIIEVMTVF